jgi:hypothetical protein
MEAMEEIPLPQQLKVQLQVQVPKVKYPNI